MMGIRLEVGRASREIGGVNGTDAGELATCSTLGDTPDADRRDARGPPSRRLARPDARFSRPLFAAGEIKKRKKEGKKKKKKKTRNTTKKSTDLVV